MPHWIPITALLGLVCLMIIPAPGWEGVAIGGVCVLIVVVHAVLVVVDRLASRVLVTTERLKKRRLAKRSVHTGSGIARKAR